MSRLIKVGLTPGDPNGIGYEVILKILGSENITDLFTPVVFGNVDIALKCIDSIGLAPINFNIISDFSQIADGKINLYNIPADLSVLNPGEISKESGAIAINSLDAAVDALKAGPIDVITTAPISKEAVQSEDFPFPGHTEYLESKIGEGNKPLMILCNEEMRVALLTIHLPLAKVAENVTKENIENTIEIFSSTLKKDFGCVRPIIAVLSLNPHCGDGGVIGNEESEIIRPALDDLRERGILAFGPYAADGFFAHESFKKFDGILAMYHDQGLAPFKALAKEGGVNFTGGLPYVRTSPDHGTAFDVAWKGVADETSMRNAIYMAIDIFKRRKIYNEASSNPLKKYSNEKPDRSESQDKAPQRRFPSENLNHDNPAD